MVLHEEKEKAKALLPILAQAKAFASEKFKKMIVFEENRCKKLVQAKKTLIKVDGGFLVNTKALPAPWPELLKHQIEAPTGTQQIYDLVKSGVSSVSDLKKAVTNSQKHFLRCLDSGAIIFTDETLETVKINPNWSAVYYLRDYRRQKERLASL